MIYGDHLEISSKYCYTIIRMDVNNSDVRRIR